MESLREGSLDMAVAAAEPVQQLRERKAESNLSTTRSASKLGKDAVSGSPTPLKQVVMVFAFVGFLMWVAYKVATGKYYTPRSNFGFYLGVVGSVMMLALLAYPLRKHVRFMHRWGALKHWFRWHMIMGIVGPTLILFHSTFHLRSLNATIALVSMLIVMASGVIGRFVYTRIHYGLYGSRATLERVQQEFTGQSDDMRPRFHMVPRVEEWLKSYARRGNQVDRSLVTMWWHLFSLGWKRRLCAFRCARELRAILRRERHPEFPGGAPEAIHLAKRFLREAERVAEFTTYERLFSLWHILHIPLIYLLAASTVFHIIAVYMY
jgi:hypothetical protein